MVNPAMFTKEELTTLKRHGVVDIGGKRYAICEGCHHVVHLNKTFFGSAHFCTHEYSSEEE